MSHQPILRVLEAIVREIDQMIDDAVTEKAEKIESLKHLSLLFHKAIWPEGLLEQLTSREQEARVELYWPKNAIAEAKHPEQVIEILHWPADGHDFGHLL